MTIDELLGMAQACINIAHAGAEHDRHAMAGAYAAIAQAAALTASAMMDRQSWFAEREQDMARNDAPYLEDYSDE